MATGTPGPDIISGSGINEFYLGLAGDDTLKGSLGFDTLDGGSGLDVADYSSIGSVVTLGAFFRTLKKGIYSDNLISIETVVGSSLQGDVVDHSGAISGGGLTVTGTNTNLTTGVATVNGSPAPLPQQIKIRQFEHVIGSIYNDTITGNDSNNSLNGGAGADTMAGGLGDDTYVVDNAGDIVTEAAAAGTDTVASSITYTLGANLENLTLTGSAAINGTGNSLDNILKGNAAINILRGGDGNDTLDGEAGADNLAGGLGNDTYVVDNTGDVVTEAAAAGTDTVESSITYTLGVNLENLTLTGVDAINGVGNTLSNILKGNGANNRLDGGAGADNMAGGLGNDTYVVDNTGDVVTEAAAAGTDTVESSITYTLGANLEYLVLTGSAAIDGKGNALSNYLQGNGANNVLDGDAGADYMVGGLGNDTYVVDNTGDQTIEALGAGTDTVQSSVSYTLAANLENIILTGTAAINGSGNELNNIIQGNGASNILDGGAGADNMAGGLGDDTYVVDNNFDIVTEAANAGNDTVRSFISYILGANLENLSLIGSEAINGTGNSLGNILAGNGASNVLDGGAGADNMAAGFGDDTYVVDNAGDLVTEVAGYGNDTVRSSITYTLAVNLENLILTGTGAINGTGNALDNILTGNTANNVLAGGFGNDTYIVNNIGDVTIEVAAAGIDTVQSSVTYSLAANLENLTLTGAVAINGTGNTLDNIITGNIADNILNGGAGGDNMAGGLGDDTYVVDNTGDAVTEAAAAGNDTIQSSITYTLAANLENLTLTGAAAINGTGNSLNNIIQGNGGNNILTGGLGGDILTGGLGIDTFKYNALADSGFGALIRDTITDFLLGTDRLDLSAIDANSTTTGDQAFTFIGTGNYTNAGQLRYQVTGGNLFLYGNVDANFATSEFELQLSGLASIAATNIIL